MYLDRSAVQSHGFYEAPPGVGASPSPGPKSMPLVAMQLFFGFFFDFLVHGSADADFKNASLSDAPVFELVDK